MQFKALQRLILVLAMILRNHWSIEGTPGDRRTEKSYHEDLFFPKQAYLLAVLLEDTLCPSCCDGAVTDS